MDIDHLKTWEGRQEVVSDRLHLETAEALAAALDMADISFTAGDPLPLPWQWLYFNPVARARDLDGDGHPKLGDFLPPVPLPRRMWAAGSMTVVRPLRMDIAAEKRSTIESVELKQGRSGALVFITVSHGYWQEGACALQEEQNIVYREEASGEAAVQSDPPAAKEGAWSKVLTPDPVLLFRYSAVTFNAHRIHHDQAYVVDVEGYPGLIVHGPLTATLMLQFVDEMIGPGKVRTFSFRAKRPLYVDRPMTLHGNPTGSRVDLWVTDAEGFIAMEAEVQLSLE